MDITETRNANRIHAVIVDWFKNSDHADRSAYCDVISDGDVVIDGHYDLRALAEMLANVGPSPCSHAIDVTSLDPRAKCCLCGEML